MFENEASRACGANEGLTTSDPISVEATSTSFDAQISIPFQSFSLSEGIGTTFISLPPPLVLVTSSVSPLVPAVCLSIQLGPSSPLACASSDVKTSIDTVSTTILHNLSSRQILTSEAGSGIPSELGTIPEHLPTRRGRRR